MPDVLNEIRNLVEEHMRVEFERVEVRASRQFQTKIEELAASGNLRSGFAFKVFADIRKDAVAERGAALWAIISDALQAVDAPYTPKLEELLYDLLAAHLPDAHVREAVVFQQMAERVGFQKDEIVRCGSQPRRELEVAIHLARRDIARKISLEMARRKRKPEASMSLLDKREDVEVEKRDGRLLGPHEAVFAGTTIVIDDPMADIEEGDTILRKLPNGKVERSVVVTATFFNEDIGPFGPHYQIEFRKGGGSPAHTPAQQINIHGGAVQFGDFNTQNVVNAFDALVKRIDASPNPAAEKDEAKALLQKALRHPLVVSLVGKIAEGLFR